MRLTWLTHIRNDLEQNSLMWTRFSPGVCWWERRRKNNKFDALRWLDSLGHFGSSSTLLVSRRFIFGLLSGSKPIFSGSRPGLGPHDVQEVFLKRPKCFAALMFVCRCRTRNISKKMNHKHYRLINVCVITKINNFAQKTRHKWQFSIANS